ncbi:NAD(P)H-dependent oxidoreductase [Croceiramulus getboli]|nr:NAD(P)H-dependent oxidoreductase [Flavobacteriaceae bacterium YJPT1-3]
MDIIERLQWRYAVKKFDRERKLSRKQIDTLTTAFNLTATSYGLQPLKMLVIQDKEVQEQLVSHSMEQRQVADASHVLVLCIEETVAGEYVNNYFDLVQDIRDTPDEVIAPFRETLVKKFEAQPAAETQEWSARQAYLAMGNLLTVCALEGIDSCPMEGFDPQGYDELLGLKERGLKSVLVLPVGYRAKNDFFADLEKVRRPEEESIIYQSR